MSRNGYARVVLAHLIELACGVGTIRRQRQKVVPLARGEALETGIGTGLNLPFYDRSGVKSTVAVDPALEMHPLGLRRVAQTGLSVRMVGLSAETLPLPDDAFDTIVCTYTLCSIPDPASALAEMGRVLAPGGKLLFSEHGRASDDAVRRWQRRLQPLWGLLAGGCQLAATLHDCSRRPASGAPCRAYTCPGRASPPTTTGARRWRADGCHLAPSQCAGAPFSSAPPPGSRPRPTTPRCPTAGRVAARRAPRSGSRPGVRRRAPCECRARRGPSRAAG